MMRAEVVRAGRLVGGAEARARPDAPNIDPQPFFSTR